MILSTTETLIIIFTVAICTFLLRSCPFILFGKNDPPKLVTYLGAMLPPAIMALLVVYCLKGLSFTSLSGFAPILISVILVAALHAWKGKSLVSIVAGTACYMFLIQIVFT